jgi:hypothetical protein
VRNLLLKGQLSVQALGLHLVSNLTDRVLVLALGKKGAELKVFV